MKRVCKTCGEREESHHEPDWLFLPDGCVCDWHEWDYHDKACLPPVCGEYKGVVCNCETCEHDKECHTDNNAVRVGGTPYPERAGSDILSTSICEVCGKHSTWGGMQSGRRMTECECCNEMTWHSFSPNKTLCVKEGH
jgi:hypothetical protein